MSYAIVPIFIDYRAPVTGATINSSANTKLILNPAGTIAALTINIPSSAGNGYQIIVSCSQIVAAVTWTGGTLIGTPLAAFAVGSTVTYMYSLDANAWFPA